MFRRRRTTAGAGVLAAAMAAASLSAPHASAVAAATSRLAGSQPSWARGQAAVSTVAGTAPVGFAVYLGWQADPSAFAQAVSTPGSASYGKYLTPAQFRARYAPSQQQVSAVSKWLSDQGFTIDYTPTNNLFVAAEGTVAQAQAAFGTTIANYSYKGLTLRSPQADLQVPSSLGITGVTGLDDSSELLTYDHVTSDAPPSPAFVNGGPCPTYVGQDTTATTAEPTKLVTTNGTVGAPGGSVSLPSAPSTSSTPFAVCGYTPEQLRGAYGLTSAQTGAGQTVAVVDAFASPTIVDDVNTYFSGHTVSGVPIPPLTGSNFSQVVAPGTFKHPEAGRTKDPQGWYGEETLDIEAVHSMAPAAHIVYVGAPNNNRDLDEAINHVVDKGLATMVTNSWGNSSEDVPQGGINADSLIFEQAAAEGIGVYFSSGDSGDETGGSGSLAAATPDWPASSPLVTSVGGTSLLVGQGNQRAGELGWEDGRAKLAGTSPTNLAWGGLAYRYGAGGGTSRIEPQPSYQAGVVPTSMSEIYGNTTPARVEPDVAADAGITTGMRIGQTQTFPDGSARYSEFRIGGTSLASPLFAGMMADVQAAKGSQVGFANPLLYSHHDTSTFRDIVQPDAPTWLVRSDYANTVDDSTGYRATLYRLDDDAPLTIHVTKGYDDVTGLGSPGSTFFSSLARS